MSLTTLSRLAGAVRTPPQASIAAVGWVRAWLITVAVLVFAMVIVGGATRLTDSGLSIVEWQPILGVIPPLSDADWQTAFDKYRQIPEYKLVNRGMSMAEFQFIFWWEWAHRFLGRIIGVAFFVPFVLFWAQGRLDRPMVMRSLVLLALGGLQGAIGWWMVSSGLSERVDVAPYRLATHLTLASVIFALLIWTLVSLGPVGGRVGLIGAKRTGNGASLRLRPWAIGLVVIALVQIYLGGLVAGNDAGLVYNTWPLMDGRFVPNGLLHMQPVWVNLFENHATLQFVHRLGAYAILAYALGYAIFAARIAPGTGDARLAVLVSAAIVTQALIGIATLLLVVPLGWALLHQGGAIIVLGLACWAAARLGRASLPA